MSSTRNSQNPVWIAIGPDTLLAMLVPLRDEHRHARETQLICGDVTDLPRIIASLGDRRATILILEDPREPSARTKYRSPFYGKGTGTNVLLSWLRLSPPDLAAYVHRACALLAREREGDRPIVLLAPRERRYLDLLDQLTDVTRWAPHVPIFRWSAERIRREPLLRALPVGAAATLFIGHGNASGWFAYGGLTYEALAPEGAWGHAETSALLFSLSCGTGQPRDPDREGIDGPGFADGAIANGIAGVVLAPYGDPEHLKNRTLTRALLEALAAGSTTPIDILTAAKRNGGSLNGYTLLGDPAIAAAASPGATARGKRIFAPAANADLSLLRPAPEQAELTKFVLR